MDHCETVVAERGECSEATAETGDKECIYKRAHIVASPKTNKNTDDKTADYVDCKCTGRIFVTEEFFPATPVRYRPQVPAKPPNPAISIYWIIIIFSII